MYVRANECEVHGRNRNKWSAVIWLWITLVTLIIQQEYAEVDEAIRKLEIGGDCL